MSGHSKWANIKHQKGAADIKRGQLFTKLTREIIIATKQGGADAEGNFRLRLAVQKARDGNMPLDNIKNAIKKGAGELDGAILTEMFLEGYGPSGAAVLLQAVSDNRNRTLQEVRNIFSRNGGNMSESGSVAWLFAQKGLIRVEAPEIDKDELTLMAIDVGAEDVVMDGNDVEIYTKPEELENVRKALLDKKVPMASTELTMIAKTTVELEEKGSLQTLRLMDKIDDLDEVQHVWSNVNFTPEIIEKYQLQAV